MAHPLPKAILFDLDDTILAYSGKTDESWQAVCDRFASRLEGVNPEALLKAIKASSAFYWSDPERHRIGRLNMDATRQQIVATALRELGIDDLPLARDMALAYAVEREEGIEPFPWCYRDIT